MNPLEPTFKGLYDGGAVPVSRAILCVDCHMITAGGGSCPSCTSKSIIPLKPLLGVIYGEPTDKLTELLTPAELRRNAKAARDAGKEAAIVKRVAEKPKLKVVGA